MKSRLIGTAGFLAALAGLALMTVSGTPQAQAGPILSIDTDPFAAPANSASTVGSIEPCRSVPSGSGSLDIDIVIRGVASLSGFEADLLYNPAVVNVTGMQDSFMLAGGMLLNLSEPVPDGDGTFRMLLATTGEGSGDGVIARLTLQPVGDGTSPLDLANVDMRDFNNNPVTPAAVEDGSVAVGTSCSPDSDNDGVPDDIDNCPAWPNPDQSLPAWPIPDGDPDCDGFATADENFISTNPNVACGIAAWPPDFNDDQWVDIFDVVLFKPVFFSSAPGPPYDARFDLEPDDNIDIFDINRLKPFFFLVCTP